MSITIISIIIIVVILAIILFINYDYSSKYKTSEKDLYYEALDLMLSGKLKESYSTLLNLIKNDTNNVKSYLMLGKVLRELGNPDRALKVHRSLLMRKDLTSYENIELHKNIAYDYKELGKLNQSIKECQKILKIEKNNEWALLELIELYKKIDDWNSSQKYLETYQKITGNLDSRILGLYIVKQGKIEFDRKDFFKARSLFEEALNMHSELSICYKLIGDTYSQESEVEYQHAKEGDEESIDKAKDFLSKALSMWIKYAQNKPQHSNNVMYLIKDSLFALDRYSELEDILEDLVQRDSNNIDALLLLADHYSNLGQNEKSVKLLDTLKEKDKQSLQARMVRLKMRIGLSDNVSDEIKDELNDITDSMSKSEQSISITSRDKDLEWLSDNDIIEQQ